MHMKRKLALFIALTAALALRAAAQSAAPANVTPAWVYERQFAKEEEARRLNVAYLGYCLPSFSSDLSGYVGGPGGGLNFSAGFESAQRGGSLGGVDFELFLDLGEGYSRIVFNDTVLFGYSFDLGFCRLNLGGRAGLGFIDWGAYPSVGDATAIGALLGPELSLYVDLGQKVWLWGRGHYYKAFYLSLSDSGSDPVSLGETELDSFIAAFGVAFRQ